MVPASGVGPRASEAPHYDSRGRLKHYCTADACPDFDENTMRALPAPAITGAPPDDPYFKRYIEASLRADRLAAEVIRERARAEAAEAGADRLAVALRGLRRAHARDWPEEINVADANAAAALAEHGGATKGDGR